MAAAACTCGVRLAELLNMKKVTNSEEYVAKHAEWGELLNRLLEILRKTELEETIKWGIPTFTLDGKNVVAVAAFKAHVAIWFNQGALLEDPDKVLVNAQKGKTQAQRQWRFEKLTDLKKTKVRKYILEAIENQRSGKVIKPRKKLSVAARLNLPEELAKAMAANPALKQAFANFPPYKQKEFIDHIIEAKLAPTRQRRLEKILPMIASGQGLNDRYRS
jgi:uncharacterized protein YdeI (YjbR/CyaY-like superfamily)